MQVTNPENGEEYEVVFEGDAPDKNGDILIVSSKWKRRKSAGEVRTRVVTEWKPARGRPPLEITGADRLRIALAEV